MKKMKKYIGLLLAAFMIANLCAARPGKVKAEENVNELNQKQEETADSMDAKPQEEPEKTEAPESQEIEENALPADTGVILQEEADEQNTAGAAPQADVDNSFPEVTGIRLLTKGDIYSSTQVELEVDYKEEGSGIKSISVTYQQEGDTEEGVPMVSFSYNEYGSGQGNLVGNGSVILQSDSVLTPGEFIISSVMIEDYAGNQNYYTKQSGETELVSYNSGERVFFIAEADTLESVYAKGLKVKNLWLDGDIDLHALKAGDSFKVTVLVYNDLDKNVTVQPEYCSVEWGKPTETAGGYGEYIRGYGQGNAFVLSPGGERELSIEAKVGSYVSTGTWELASISLNQTGGQLPSTDYTSPEYAKEGEFVGHIFNYLEKPGFIEGEVESIYYSGELDFSVTSAETPDTEAPILEEVSVTPQEVRVPGKIQVKLKTKEEISALTEVTFVFNDIENPIANAFGNTGASAQRPDPVYSEEEGCYIVEYELPETLIKGTYELGQINLTDEAGNTSFYTAENGKLIGYQYGATEDIPEVDTCSFDVVETEATDEDFDNPKLTGIEVLNNEVAVSETLRIHIEAEDAMGISSVSLNYACDNDKDGIYEAYLTMKSKNIVIDNTGYVCEFDVDPYCVSGTYDLQDITLIDGSVRKNSAMCVYEKDENLIIGDYPTTWFYPEKSLALSVEQAAGMEIMDIRTDDIEAGVQGIENGKTIVIKGSDVDDLEIRLFPADFWSSVQEKNLTVVIPDGQSNSEVVVKGSEIGDASFGDMELKVQRDELVEQAAGVGNDDMYYPVRIVTTDTAIPVTVRIRVDQEFLDQCGDNPIRISKIGADGSVAIMQDNLTVTEDGYLEVAFPNGLQGTGTATQMLNAGAEGRSITSQEFSFVVSSEAKDDVMLGDINGDGQVNLVDLMQCLNHVGRKTFLTGNALLAADIDQSGDVNLVDLMRLLNYVGRKTDTL